MKILSSRKRALTNDSNRISKQKADKPTPKPYTAVVNKQFRKTYYQKYKCQSKHRAIYTKLLQDTGYPQQILQKQLNQNNTNNQIQKRDYVNSNKKNLKNFFQQRIPPENTLIQKLMKKDEQIIHPRRIFQMKQQQYQLKSKTKMNLQHQLKIKQPKPHAPDPQKLTNNFVINDKTQQLKQKYASVAINPTYHHENHRIGTQSHINKRASIIKKQAYTKVFGPDLSAFSRTNVVKSIHNLPQQIQNRIKSTSLTLSPRKLQSNLSKDSSIHHQLRSLIVKMNQYKNKLQDSIQIYHPPKQLSSNKFMEDKMLSTIKSISKTYQFRTINQGMTHIDYLADLRKISPQFFIQMQEHKQQRLSRRKQLVQDYNQSIFSSLHSHHDLKKRGRTEVQSQLSVRDQVQIKNIQIHQGTKSVKQRFSLLKKSLVRWASLLYTYGIDKNNIFLAFRKQKQPYQLEGSYAFFKCIKLGDTQGVRAFLLSNSHYVFQVQANKKSALSYACFRNRLQIVKQILKIGVNSDLACSQGKTSLYYAVQSNNIEIAKLILQNGASPWSTQHNPYRKMCENNQQMSNLFKNAKKIYLCMQILQTINKKRQFWSKCRHLIIQKQLLSFPITV